ncbi:ABC transporter-like [Moorella glycerini]|uniref:Sn-glycerol-3-phosphate import ATP-binding protein UgpC n=1 Tax=Neomoorella stamsii TaxID=1266720 RepID=A0A9X7J558_9FIRM|nr:sn-glycerol-3-phosphate import ATP-binding protein UgpC [Moorella stamsii]CEP66560.1 ABC transporter-like [Moorella glycerini]
MVAGLENITEGLLLIDGQTFNNVPVHERDIAMVFENYALYPHMNVYDNLAFPLKSPARKEKLSTTEIKERIRKVADMLEIGHLLERKPSQLSGGQRQRVSLGRALVRTARVTLMDEPLAHLDAKLRHYLRGELKRWHIDNGYTTIYVTHDYIEALAMADKVAILKEGVLQQVGTPNDIYTKPANTFVATSVGDPPMNIIEGELLRNEEGKLAVRTNFFTAPLRSFIQDVAAKDKRLLVGVRPHDVKLTRQGKLKVCEKEPLDSENILIVFQCGSVSFTVKTSSNVKVSLGDMMGLEVNSDKIHLFDTNTGTRLI